MQRDFVRSDGKTLQYTKTRYDNYYTLLWAWKYRHRTMQNIGNGLKSTFNDRGDGKNFLAYMNSESYETYKELEARGILSIVNSGHSSFFTYRFMLRVNDRELMDFVFSIDSLPTAEFDNHIKLRTTLDNGKVTLQNIEYKDTKLEKCVNSCSVL